MVGPHGSTQQTAYQPTMGSNFNTIKGVALIKPFSGRMESVIQWFSAGISPKDPLRCII